MAKKNKKINDRKLIRSINSSLSNGMENFSKQGSELWEIALVNKTYAQKIAISYLIERVLSSARNCCRLHYIYPRQSAQDMASMSRGMFESVINVLYLLTDNDQSKLASFWKLSIKEEQSYDTHLSKWCESESDDLAYSARSERESRLTTPENISDLMQKEFGFCIDTATKWPPLYKRAKRVGEIWEYFYDLRYRAYSTWQHGDLSRAILSPCISIDLPNMKDRAQSEGISVLSWCHEVMFQFLLELNVLVGTKDREQVIRDIHSYTINKTEPLIGYWRLEHPTDPETIK